MNSAETPWLASFSALGKMAGPSVCRCCIWQSITGLFRQTLEQGLGQHAEDPENPGQCCCRRMLGT